MSTDPAGVGKVRLVLSNETCTVVYILWEADGDSIEVTCTLTGEHTQHEAEVEGTVAFADNPIRLQLPAIVCWPISVKVGS